MRLISGFILASFPAFALAHSADSAMAWNWEPWLVISLALAAFVYAGGAINLARSSDSLAAGRRSLAFWLGWLALIVALVSPLDSMGNQLFSAHMIQHEILMLIAAPLIVLGRPLAVFTWALPAKWRSFAARPLQSRPWRMFWRGLTAPLTAWGVHALVLWVWHAPWLFQLSVRDEPLHVAQHFAFFVSALLFWGALLKRRASAPGALYLLTTMIHTGVLGALLTFAPVVLYPIYVETAPHWGLTALEDQQLGGLVMWVPAGFILLFAGIALIWRVLLEPSSGKQTA